MYTRRLWTHRDSNTKHPSDWESNTQTTRLCSAPPPPLHVWYTRDVLPSVPSQRGQGAGAAPGVVGEGEVGDGAELQAPGQ